MTTEIKVPTLGESVTEATVGQWFKKEGDSVQQDEPLVELETDKVTVEVPAPKSGRLQSISVKDGETVGFMLSGPELGTLWLYWTYLFPEHRKSNMAVRAVRAFIEHWDNGRFHKIATYTKDGNDVAAAIMLRLGFTFTARLEQHIFGEDYLLYERKLNKTQPGYDRGAATGRAAQLRRQVGRLFGR